MGAPQIPFALFLNYQPPGLSLRLSEGGDSFSFGFGKTPKPLPVLFPCSNNTQNTPFTQQEEVLPFFYSFP